MFQTSKQQKLKQKQKQKFCEMKFVKIRLIRFDSITNSFQIYHDQSKRVNEKKNNKKSFENQ